MENESAEQRVWNWLKRLSGWHFEGSGHEKEFSPNVGIIPAALALVIGDQKIYFATGEVKDLDNAHGYGRSSVDATFVAEKGIYRLEGTISRGSGADNPVVTWHPLSIISSMRVETNKNWWHENPYYYLSVVLETSVEGAIALELPRTGLAAHEDLVATVQFLQGAGVRQK